jgi:PA14 domain
MSVNHLQNKDASNKVLTVAFGRQAATGHLTRSKWDARIVAYNALGEGEWEACEAAYYKGIEIPPADYNFHTGALATAMDSGPQIVDDNFEGDVPHSRTAAIGYKGPTGIGDSDTKANPPLEFKGIFKTKKCIDLDDSGEETGFTYSANPARVVAELFRGYGRIPNLPADYESHWAYWKSRIDWQVWAEWQSYLATTETVDYTTWTDFEGFGLTASYYNGTSFGTFVTKFVQPIIDVNFGSASPAAGVTHNDFSARFEGYVLPEIDGDYTFTLVHYEGAKLWVNSVLVIDAWTTSGASASSSVTLAAGTFAEIKIEWKNTGSTAQLQLFWSASEVPEVIIPTKYLYPKTQVRPRYEAHIYFDTPINFADALRKVLFISNSIMQEVNGKLHFYCLEQLESSFDLDDSNIDSIRFKRRDLLQADPVTAFESKFRDLDSQFLEEPETPIRIEPAYLARKTAENVKVIDLYNTTRWQAKKVLLMRSKLEVEYDITTEVSAKTAKTYPVIAGDLVTVTHRKLGIDPRLFLVREAVDVTVAEASGDQGKDSEKRTFILQNWTS